ncbi:hypothetical protein BOX15_Mlig004623g1 [Macrostomum lignano]|uniref:Uncharacterized protein n=1 Tax=Macrostomum lignano TaxID=282301 RepID=A0A267GKL9_9PLAT|nr:hypothetical protein BOX15_Mlig004623g1 [Macrostomum lignano]
MLLLPSVDPTVVVTNSKRFLLDGGVIKELACMKTGRISDKTDHAYIDVRNDKQMMSSVLYHAVATPKVETAFDRRLQAQAVGKRPADAGVDKASAVSLHQK